MEEDLDLIRVQPDVDGSRVQDGVTIALNDVEWSVGNLPSIRKRPGSKALKPEWVSYGISLGGDRNSLMSSEYTVEGLIALCDRLGG